jgi:hypothetical protein
MTLMRAPRRQTPIRRTLGAIGLAYALVLQVFVGGYLTALHAAPAVAAGLAAICPADDAPAGRPLGPAHRHDGADPCCLFGCAASGAPAPPAERWAPVPPAPGSRTAFRGPEAQAVSRPAQAGPLGARAPPGIA